MSFSPAIGTVMLLKSTITPCRPLPSITLPATTNVPIVFAAPAGFAALAVARATMQMPSKALLLNVLSPLLTLRATSGS